MLMKRKKGSNGQDIKLNADIFFTLGVLGDGAASRIVLIVRIAGIYQRLNKIDFVFIVINSVMRMSAAMCARSLKR